MYDCLYLAICRNNLNEIITRISPYIASPFVGVFVGIVFGAWVSLPKTKSDRFVAYNDPNMFAIVGATRTISFGIFGFVCNKLIMQVITVLIPCVVIFGPFYIVFMVYATNFLENHSDP